MSACCSPAGYREVFGEKTARRDARKYRKKGLNEPARWLVDALVERGVEGATVLEVGGGVGALQLELLKAGAARTVNIELSPGYEEAAAELAHAAGLEGRSERRVADFVADGEIDDADVVLMHRVVCCYPDYEGLVGAAARRARRLLVFSFPPRNAPARLFFAGGNLWLRITGKEFRAYAHPPAAMIEVAARHGFEPVAERRHGIWRAVALERTS